MAEITSLRDALAGLVSDGAVVAMEGFTHLIPFAAGHEVIRQRRKNLTLIRLTPDLIYDQLIGAGCAKKLIFSWGGNPGVGSLHRLRDAVEHNWPAPLEIEEYSHAGLSNAYVAGAANLPFGALRGYAGSDLPKYNAKIRFIKCPFTGEELAAVPAVRPDVTIIHAQKADRKGNVLLWGVLGVQKEAVMAAKHAIVCVEEIVDDLGAWPNACVLPSWIVSAVCCVPGGAFPSYAQGYYSRENSFYLQWDAISRTREGFASWMQRLVLDTEDFAAFKRVLGEVAAEKNATSTSSRGRAGTKAKASNSADMMTVSAARLLKDGAVCFVGIGLPSKAANLARLTHAPNIVLIYESGPIGTKPQVLPLSIGDGELAETADAVVSTSEIFRYWLQGGRIDVGFLGAAQIDRYANINTTVIGEYQHPITRLPGAGGAPEIADSAGEVLLVLQQSARTFVERLDFITSAGHLDGGDARKRLGLRGAGPVAVVTDLCVMMPDPVTKELTVTQLHPGVTREQVQKATGWEIRFAATVEQTEPPSTGELQTLRDLERRTAIAHGQESESA